MMNKQVAENYIGLLDHIMMRCEKHIMNQEFENKVELLIHDLQALQDTAQRFRWKLEPED